MLALVMKVLFDCRHKRYTFPITVKSAPRVFGRRPQTGSYVVCLDCAKEFPYDWEEMKVIWEPEDRRAHVPETQTEITVARALDACVKWWHGLSRMVRYGSLFRG